ncbi:hypothetical protein ABL78_1128 [Leptomonas seymouri]|uniref:BAR domain-containing protein n=1 Tax=Leptomonas seymouri TaxID=5684 RepID=A0A0N1PF56_LEPSE|nr:hypothetical protein ABL78_1128 [Leptomonas seymouri]|eukprot:KPI89748.1 hypothetical protein ABL78_1128 [Leptomonas seymouri]
MTQTDDNAPESPKGQQEITIGDSLWTVSVRAPPSASADKPRSGEPPTAKDSKNKDRDKDAEKKFGFMSWKDKTSPKGAEVVTNAADGGKACSRPAGGSSDDEDDVEESDEETEDMWCTSTKSNMPSATAIAIRNLPAVDFLNMKEEERIKGELKDVKNLHSKLYRIMKLMKKAVKEIRFFSEANENAVASIHAAMDNTCTDSTIIDLAAASKKRIQEVGQSNALSILSTNITDQILEQIKPIKDHAKMVSVAGKERRTARDRRIHLALGEVDVANEEEYNRLVDVVHDFEEKDRIYKDEFINFHEHNSSQLGQMLRCYLFETATYLETVAKAMRESAGSATNNYYLNDDCCAKFKNFREDTKLSAPLPPLFSRLRSDAENDDRLTAKPHPKSSLHPHPPGQAAAVAGIPMTDTRSEEGGQHTYSSSHIQAKDGSCAHRNIEQFLLSSQLPISNSKRMVPRPLPGHSRCVEGPQAARNNSLLSRASAGVDNSSVTMSLMNYIHSLADEYGIEPDFSATHVTGSANRGAKSLQK